MLWGVGDGKHSVILWLGLSLSVSLSLWTVTFTSFLVFFSLKWDKMCRLGISLPQVTQSLIKPCSLGSGCLASLEGRPYLECPGIVLNGPFSPPPLKSIRRFFSGVYCENLVRLLEVNLTILWLPPRPLPIWLGSSGVFNYQARPHWAASNSSMIVQVFLFNP